MRKKQLVSSIRAGNSYRKRLQKMTRSKSYKNSKELLVALQSQLRDLGERCSEALPPESLQKNAEYVSEKVFFSIHCVPIWSALESHRRS